MFTFSLDRKMENVSKLRILCNRRMLLPSKFSTGIQWLIGSHRFFPRFTVISSLRCLHTIADGDQHSPDFTAEADDLKILLPKGLDIVGALYICSGSLEEHARKAFQTSYEMSKILNGVDDSRILIGSASDTSSGDIQFFSKRDAKSDDLELISNVVYEYHPDNYLWEIGCLLRCQLAFKLPLYVPLNKTSDIEKNLSSVITATVAKFRDSSVTFLVEKANVVEEDISHAIMLQGAALDFRKRFSDFISHDISTIESEENTVTCSDFCSSNKSRSSLTRAENADIILISVLSNQSRSHLNYNAPSAEYFPAPEPARLVNIEFSLDVLSYASKDYPVSDAISQLVVPGLIDQLNSMKLTIMPNLLKEDPLLHPYHFQPPGILHPVTAIFDLRYGEKEMKQVGVRKALHLRLGLPLDRPLLLISKALSFDSGCKGSKGISSLLRDVHREIPSSGVSGGVVSLIDGSYEYYHYLHDGFDDNGWGCAYRSLQTIISWFRLQNYTSTDVPSHREIQQTLVDVGDKEPSFIGSREWIGAIELSFVLDKLLGLQNHKCTVGEELPEKCRELAAHFETQGTPVMIGGGVLAYTLLGVDYDEVSGDCAFLILDPHYTGNDDLKKIINGGWCGWKKAVDSKGRSFFLKDKFYNLLLPQRLDMV